MHIQNTTISYLTIKFPIIFFKDITLLKMALLFSSWRNYNSMKLSYLFTLCWLFFYVLPTCAQNEVQNNSFPFWKLKGNTLTDTALNFVGTTDLEGLTFRTNNIRRMTIDEIGQVGIGTVNPINTLQVNGDIRIGMVRTGPFGTLPGNGNLLYFSGGPAASGYDSDNTDPIYFNRLNLAADVSELRLTIGDNPGPANLDNFSLGSIGSNYDLFFVRTDGNIGIGTRTPDSRLDVHGKTTISRDGITECCSNDATLALAELTTGAGGTGRVSSISFHNGNQFQGQLSLVADATGIGIVAGRLRLSTSGLGGGGLGLQITGGLYYGNGDSRTETRNDAGLQGNAGAQSGFYETTNPVNYPAGASSWWHLIDTRHSNNANNYAMQIAGSFFDQRLFFRKTNGAGNTGWNELLSTPQGVAPIQIHSFTLNTNHTPDANTPTFDINTNIAVANFDCILAEWNTAFDIQESTRRNRRMWLYHNTSTNNWHVSINVGAHSNANPNWTNTDVKCLCFTKSFVNWNGNPRNTLNNW